MSTSPASPTRLAMHTYRTERRRVKSARARRAGLRRDLAEFTTPSQIAELHAILARYDSEADETLELRRMLTELRAG